MPESFNVGDIVQLKSGGPKMTVNAVDKGYSGGVSVYCVWFAGAKREGAKFSGDTLKLVPTEDAEE